MITWTWSGVFIFPPHIIYCSYFTSGNCQVYQQKLNKIMKILQEDVILIKNLSVKAVWCTKSVESIARQGLETLKHRQSAEEKSQDGYNVPQPCSVRQRSSRIAVEDFVLSQDDKPKRHRWAREISHETAILYSSVHRKIIHRDLQLTCFKWCRAQLLSEANRISRLTHRWTTLSSAINLVIVML